MGKYHGFGPSRLRETVFLQESNNWRFRGANALSTSASQEKFGAVSGESDSVIFAASKRRTLFRSEIEK
jgi:hypothetical protein